MDGDRHNDLVVGSLEYISLKLGYKRDEFDIKAGLKGRPYHNEVSKSERLPQDRSSSRHGNYFRRTATPDDGFIRCPTLEVFVERVCK